MDPSLSFLFLLHLLNDGVRTGLVSLLPFVARDFNLNYTVVGFLGSSQGVLAAILAIPAGFLSSRIGGLKLLLFSQLIYSIGALAIGLTPNTILLIPFFYFAAGGFGMFHTVGYTLVAKLSEKTKIGRNMGNFTAVGDIGRIAFPIVLLFIASTIGWRLAAISLAAIGCSIFFYVLLIKKIKIPKEEIQTQHHTLWLKQMLLLAKQKHMLLVLTAAILDGLAGNPMYIFLPFFLLTKGITTSLLGLFIGVYFLGSFLGKSLLGRMVDLYGNRKVFLIAELTMALVIVFLIFLKTAILLLIFSFLLGLATRGTTPVLSTIFSEIANPKQLDKVFAVSELFMGVTAALAPTLMGVIADIFGIYAVFYVAALFALTATIPLLFYQKTLTEEFLAHRQDISDLDLEQY